MGGHIHVPVHFLVMDEITSMYVRNNSGPSTEPCGTPDDNTGREFDELPYTTNCCFLSERL